MEDLNQSPYILTAAYNDQLGEDGTVASRLSTLFIYREGANIAMVNLDAEEGPRFLLALVTLMRLEKGHADDVFTVHSDHPELLERVTEIFMLIGAGVYDPPAQG